MKVLEANNLSQAVKELNKIDKSLVEKLNADVKDADKKYYHVILVKVKDRPGQAKNEVTFIVQTYNARGFEKIKKNYVFQDFSQVILLHDPTQLSDEDLQDNKSAKKTSGKDDAKDETIANQKQTISAKDQEIADLKAQLASKENGGADDKKDKKSGDDKKTIGDDFDVETADFKGLNEYAAANEIPLNGKRSTDDIRVEVKKWLASQK